MRKKVFIENPFDFAYQQLSCFFYFTKQTSCSLKSSYNNNNEEKKFLLYNRIKTLVENS